MTEGSWSDAANPFTYLAGAAGKVVADGWTAAMLGLWNAGLWALRLVLKLMDYLLTPDLRADGPGAELYRVTFWLAGALAVVMILVQLGVAAFRRDGASLARVVIGSGQFAIVWAAWLAYGVTVVAACGGLTRGLLEVLLNVNSWSAWQPWAAFSTEDIADGTVATVLGLMGLLLWLSAIGHLLVLLTRAGALLVLAATTPISAAGLMAEAGRAWFWKSLRWFHAAALTPVLTTLVLGVGVQMTTGVANGLSDSTEAAIGTALPGVILILIGCFSPLALFRMLAFVDPGTTSGAALRQGLAAQGGLQGLLAGSGSASNRSSGAESAGGAQSGAASGGTSSAASRSDGNGRSEGEAASAETTSARFTDSAAGFLSSVGGAVGGAAAAGLGFLQDGATAATTVGSDLSSQMGVGHSTYHPDFSSLSRTGARAPAANTTGTQNGPGAPGGPGAPDGPGTPTTLGDAPPGGSPLSGGGAGQPPSPAPTPPSGPSRAGTSPSGGPPSGSTPSGSASSGDTPASTSAVKGGGGRAAAASTSEAAAVPLIPV